MSKENPSFQEKLHSIEAQSMQIGRAMGLASAIVDDTKSVIGEYFPKDILPTDASTATRLMSLVDLGIQRKKFVEQTRDISIPQLIKLKGEIGSKLIAEAAREAANLIEGSYYTAEEESEIKELLLGTLNRQQDQSKTVPEIAYEAPPTGVETAPEKQLKHEEAENHIELEGTVKSRETKPSTPGIQIPESQQLFPRFFRKDELQKLTEILVNNASKNKPLDSIQITKQLFENQLNSGEMSFMDALKKTKRFLGSIQKLGEDKGLQIINYGNRKHPFYYGIIESNAENKAHFEAQIKPSIQAPEEQMQEEDEKPVAERINNPHKTPEEITRNGTTNQKIYKALYYDYPSDKGLSNVDIAQIIFAKELEKGTMDLTTAVSSVLDNGSVLFTRLRKAYGIKIENIGVIRPGQKRPATAYYRLPILETNEDKITDSSASTTEALLSDKSENVTKDESKTPAPLTPMVADISVSVPKVQEEKLQLRSLVLMPEKKALMVDGEMNYFPDSREAGRMMNIVKKISSNPSHTWLASEFIERDQNIVNVLENLRELKKFFTKNGFGEVLEIDEDGSEAIISFKGKLRTRDFSLKK